ncbi:hypothetical protein AAJ76_6000114062 [Vairimorpha ceranae]|uniref:Uncharacterized protein n=1 Tax=Vairimorpha ceranae TaxID=40302 RepID=A0A0F9ZFL7_9MICR|nr:hypothetical protein AAJ76_6000114062 [Vairimorpha ceranae]KKO76194.1 hypothetical protein AAJ76_6000114062 [Vairimorpha ceranae]
MTQKYNLNKSYLKTYVLNNGVVNLFYNKFFSVNCLRRNSCVNLKVGLKSEIKMFNNSQSIFKILNLKNAYCISFYIKFLISSTKKQNLFNEAF